MKRWSYDLKRMASEIKGVGRFKELADAIDRYHSAFSLQADLLEARRAIDALREIHSNEIERTKFAAALMTHAVDFR